jgi:hypothetical protein
MSNELTKRAKELIHTRDNGAYGWPEEKAMMLLIRDMATELERQRVVIEELQYSIRNMGGGNE